MMKIHIIGGPGSGKTSLAHYLSKRYNVSRFDLDDIFWDRHAARYGIKASPEKRNAELQKILNNESWIIEGVYYAWLKTSFHASDLIIVLKTSPLLRDVRIIRRFAKRKLGILKTKKESLADLWRLIKWNHGYDKNNLKPALDFISDYHNKIIFPMTEDQFIEEIKFRNIGYSKPVNPNILKSIT